METVILLGIILSIAFVVLNKRPQRRRLPPKTRSAKPKIPTHRNKSNNWGLADPERQLNAVSKVSFERKPLLNKSEYRVLVELEQIAKDAKQGLRVMAQTSLGEVLSPIKSGGDWKVRKDAFASINSKRLDFAVFDRFGLLVIAIEYQGSGHYHQKTFMRDAVKKEALRRAGVPYLEVPKGMKPSELRTQLEKHLMIEA